MYPFRSKATFYGVELLAPPPYPKLEDYLLSAIRDFLFNIFASTLHIGGRSSILNWGLATLWWQRPSYHGDKKIYALQNVVKWTNNKQIRNERDNKGRGIGWMLTPAPHVYPQFALCSQKVAPCLLPPFLVFRTTHIVVSKLSVSY